MKAGGMQADALKTAVTEKLGVPGIVGAGLVLFSLAFYFGTIAPAREDLQRVEADKTRLAAMAARGQRAAAATPTPAAALPPIAQAPELLRRLDAAAAGHGLVVERTVYQIKGKDGSTRRLEVELPLRASYPALRSFLRDALKLAPGAALENLNLQRNQASDPAVNADLRLSFAFSAS